MIIRTNGNKSLEEQFDQGQPLLPGLLANEPNPLFRTRVLSEKNLIYASEHIVAQWKVTRKGEKRIKLWRPNDPHKSAIWTTADKDLAIKACRLIDEHQGNFGAEVRKLLKERAKE